MMNARDLTRLRNVLTVRREQLLATLSRIPISEFGGQLHRRTGQRHGVEIGDSAVLPENGRRPDGARESPTTWSLSLIPQGYAANVAGRHTQSAHAGYGADMSEVLKPNKSEQAGWRFSSAWGPMLS